MRGTELFCCVTIFLCLDFLLLFCSLNIIVNVKWGKEKFDAVELNTEEPPMVFKAQLFALTGVQPERQKVMVKGGTLKVPAAICNGELSYLLSSVIAGM